MNPLLVMVMAARERREDECPIGLNTHLAQPLLALNMVLKALPL